MTENISMVSSNSVSASFDQTNDQHPRKTKAILQSQFYKTRMCPYINRRGGGCKRKSNCYYAHSPFELQSTVDLTKTKMCHKFETFGSCSNENCTFAHGMEELRSTFHCYKTQQCRKFMQSGACTAGYYCRHAHGEEEFQLVTKLRDAGLLESSMALIHFGELLDSLGIKMPESSICDQPDTISPRDPAAFSEDLNKSNDCESAHYEDSARGWLRAPVAPSWNRQLSQSLPFPSSMECDPNVFMYQEPTDSSQMFYPSMTPRTTMPLGGDFHQNIRKSFHTAMTHGKISRTESKGDPDRRGSAIFCSRSSSFLGGELLSDSIPDGLLDFDNQFSQSIQFQSFYGSRMFPSSKPVSDGRTTSGRHNRRRTRHSPECGPPLLHHSMEAPAFPFASMSSYEAMPTRQPSMMRMNTLDATQWSQAQYGQQPHDMFANSYAASAEISENMWQDMPRQQSTSGLIPTSSISKQSGSDWNFADKGELHVPMGPRNPVFREALPRKFLSPSRSTSANPSNLN